jgi:hypothetical protein
MKKATMFAVGMLMIAMLVGLGASAEAPAESYDDWQLEKKQRGQFQGTDVEEHSHPLWETQWIVVGSRGGTYACCVECYGECPPDEPVRI